jgi:anaerobic magnesium-protoporphyrin IX monomethyl ester cyclase
MDFCRALDRSGLDVRWKAFGRVNLTDVEMMHAMADCGCVELRFGIESGSDRILKRSCGAAWSNSPNGTGHTLR